MIDFVELVNSCLIFESIAGEAPFSAFYEDTSEFTELRTHFNNTFDISMWPKPSAVFPILQDAYVRPRAEALIPFADSYPLMDFIWYVVEKTPDKGTDVLNLSGTAGVYNFQSEKINDIAGSFLESCKDNNRGTNLHPLFGYVPSSAKATAYQRPLQKKISNVQVGKLNLNQFNNLSIRKALYGILEIRRKARVSVLKNKNIPNSIKWIDGILQNPEKYAGQIQIPNEIKVLYDRVSGQQLVELAATLHEFYESEKATAASTRPPVTDVTTRTIQNTFMHFISNEGATTTTNYLFTTIAEPDGFESPNIAGAKGGYTIENIKKINTPQAKEVINELTNLANFVSEGEPIDWSEVLSGLKNAATGLALGT